jgi:hypothetical protein
MVVHNWFPNKTTRIILGSIVYYYIIIYYLVGCYIYNQNSAQVYHGLKIMNLLKPSFIWFLVLFISLTGHLVHVAIPASRVHVGWD